MIGYTGLQTVRIQGVTSQASNKQPRHVLPQQYYTVHKTITTYIAVISQSEQHSFSLL